MVARKSVFALSASAARGVRGEEAGAPLRHEVIGGTACERAVRAERRHDSDDERRVGCVQCIPAEPERLGPRSRAVVNDDAGCRDEARKGVAANGRLQIEHNRALAAIEWDEEPSHVRRDGHHLPVGVPTRGLDLDHVGAEFGEQRTGERAGDILRHLDHADALERQVHRGPGGVHTRPPSPLRAITSCCTSAVPPAIVEPTDAR